MCVISKLNLLHPSEAANWARKSQVCFNECLRTLEPHMELVPEKLVSAVDELKEAGLLQSLRIYELMYGGKSLQFGIKGNLVFTSRYPSRTVANHYSRPA